MLLTALTYHKRAEKSGMHQVHKTALFSSLAHQKDHVKPPVIKTKVQLAQNTCDDFSKWRKGLQAITCRLVSFVHHKSHLYSFGTFILISSTEETKYIPYIRELSVYIEAYVCVRAKKTESNPSTHCRLDIHELTTHQHTHIDCTQLN